MPDLGALFELTVHPLELFLRGTAMSWLLFLLFRFVLHRDVGAIGIRQHGIEKLEQVKAAIMEGDGEISVIKYEGEAEAPKPSGKDKALG